MTLRTLLRKPVASILKRYFILTNGGYSIGSAYGARYLFDWRHSLDKKVALELYEHDQISYLTKALDHVQPNIFVDIGSHAALYSIVFKARYPSLVVHAFEPDRTNLCQLYANLFINKLQRDVQVHEFGLSDRSGKIRFETSEETSSRGTRRISESGNIEIEIKRLDDVLKPTNQVIAIKIDVEGHENQVVDGAINLLGTNKCFLQIECLPENLNLLKQKMDNLGYPLVGTLSRDHYFTNIAPDPSNEPSR